MDPGPSFDPRPSGQGDTDSNCSTSKRICKYDVFISFRGPDTRNSFTDHLFSHLTRKGIFTFKDDKRLEPGEPISSQLVQAIKDSRVSIVVFSEDYAFSTWCLEEMATIADWQNELNQTVFPVFYDVEPSVVRYQTGRYKFAFSRHEQIFFDNPSKVDRWKRAMTNLANDNGFVVKDKPQVREIEKIVQAVIKSLDHKFSGYADDIIGIQSRVHELENLLKLSAEDDSFRVLGIWGMGGIGKTTLATVLYDRISYQFRASCFIENVSQDYKAGGAIAIQRQILRQTLVEENLDTYSPSEISGIVRKRLHNIQVLVVLDNVDEFEQLKSLAISREFLYAGSRIIITTRDEHILKLYRADAVYKVPLLNNDDAREIFCRLAFRSDDPGNRFVELTSEVLKYIQGLPLAIRVMGSFLFGRDAIQWRDAMNRVGTNPEKQIMDVLWISFEPLRSDEKEIFLHIACFFVGERVDYVKRILDCCGLYPHVGIAVLIEKSLITFRNREIHMHEMMQELGKKIVREKSPKDPGSWSRLWCYQDFHDVLTLGTGTDKNKAVVLNQTNVLEYSPLQVEELCKMKELELLILYEMKCSGRLNFLSNRLYFLLWHGYPFTYLPPDFQPNKLIELNMSNSSIERLWEGIKNLPCLKMLDLSNSRNLVETPNFEGIQNLERLDLTGCTNLWKVHPSIGLLKHLAFLSLRNCCSLVSFYLGSVSKLSSLRVLDLLGCIKLEKTPNFIGMPNLEYLDLEQCLSLSTIHESLGALGKLKFLSLRHCTNLERIPSSVNTMISLETLDLSNCLKLKNLTLGERSELGDFVYLGKDALVPSGCLESLIILDLGFCNLCEVADAIGELRCLERLNLQGNNFGSVPDTISRLCSLAYLNLSHCHELQYLPLLPSMDASSVGRYFERVSGSRNHRSGLYMFDCPKLVESELDGMRGSGLALAWLTRLIENPRHFRCGFDIVIPGHVIPKWFNYQFLGGSAIRIVQSDVDDNWMGFAFCVAFEVNYHQSIFDSSHDSSSSPLTQSSSPSSSPPPPHPLYLSFESENTEEIFGMPLGFDLEKSVDSKHLWIIYISRPHCHFVKTAACISFKARPGLEIRKWAIRMIFKQDTMSKLLLTGEGNQGDHLRFDYESETQRWRRFWPKVQLPYNWLVIEEEEIENMRALEKENNISTIGLGQPLLDLLPSSSRNLHRKLPPRDTYSGSSSDPRPSSQGDTDSNCSTSKRICKYDVFISFINIDASNNFTDHLCNHLIRKGIFTFKNDKVLKAGQPISLQLLEAIKDSRLSIVVFSKDYATSTWCLEEMSTIADCQNDLKQTVFPIFYDVDPSVVRNQTEVYGDAFVLHRKKFESKVDRWKRAMTGLANNVGWDVRDKPESIEIEKIAHAVIKTLGHKFSGLADGLIGIQPRVHKLENLLKLSSEDDDFRVLGIWGMGGIGKTTLTTVLCDKISYQFDACCFIENVSQIYKDGGAVAVQKQILRQIMDEKFLETYSPSEISGIVRNRLGKIKVLVVLDNVDQLEQLEKLAVIPKLLCAGSRIIIATRDVHILKVYGADAVHKVPLLDTYEAHKLFCRIALKSDDPGSRFVELTSEVLKYTQGLPLAIRVMGSILYGRNAIEWRDALERRMNNLDKQIMDVLRISFEGLKPIEKDIFLHIACFFVGEREEYVKRILDYCGLHPHIGIQVLIEQSLITISNQEIHMHGMVQELGKKIVREETPRDPASWSRLWLYKDFYHVMMSRMGTNKIKAIVLDPKKDLSKYAPLQVEELSKMGGLELLILYEMNCSGRLDFLSNSLHFLLWHGYPFTYLPSDFQPNQLVELNMSNSKIIRLWEGIKNLPSLKRLDLSNSINLPETPNFEGTPNLEKLDLTGCTNLWKVHPSMGLLKQLAFLSLRSCCSLVSFYLGSVSNLRSLRVLNLSGCIELENTPDFTGMPNLEYLDLERCICLSTIHESLGALGKFKFLSLRDCTNLERIPSSVNTMISLETLDLSNCLKLKNLPLGERSELGDFVYLGKDALVPSGCLESLIILDLGFCNLCEVPDAIGELRCLERLNLQGNNFLSLPSTLCLLSSLAYLNLSHCHELHDLSWLPSISGSKIGGMYFKKVSGSRNHRSGLYIFDCPKLTLDLKDFALAWLIRLSENPHHFRCGFDIVIPGSEIPWWFDHQSMGGSAIRIVQSDMDDNWIGFTFCVAFEVNYDQANFDSSYDSSSSPLTQSSSPSPSPPPPHPLYLSFESENTEEIFGMPLGFDLEKSVGSKHLWLIYISRPHCHFVKTAARISFKARPGLEIMKWGIRMVLRKELLLHRLEIGRFGLRCENKPPSKVRISGKQISEDNDNRLSYIERRLRRYGESNRVSYACESPMCSSRPRVQLPYNWLVTEEEEMENMGAKEKEINVDIIGLCQPPLKHTPSSSSSPQS